VTVGDTERDPIAVPPGSTHGSQLSDLWPGTLAGQADQAPSLKSNRYGTTASGEFVSEAGEFSGLTLADTHGCSASQIIEAAGLGFGHERFGLSRSTLLDWAAT
jgi:hypothetical protein